MSHLGSKQLLTHAGRACLKTGNLSGAREHSTARINKNVSARAICAMSARCSVLSIVFIHGEMEGVCALNELMGGARSERHNNYAPVGKTLVHDAGFRDSFPRHWIA